MRFIGILLLSVLVIVMFSAAVCAQVPAPTDPAPVAASAPPPPPPPPPPPSRTPPSPIVRNVCPSLMLSLPMNIANGPMMEYIALTDEQKPKITEAQEKFQTKLLALNTTLQAATKQLVDAIAAGDATPAKLKELSVNASKAEAEVLQARVDLWDELKNILTAEQYKKLASQTQNRFQGPGAFGGPMAPRTTGPPPPLSVKPPVRPAP
jgi:Spy/CpxP family protein refolding chaperone